MLYPLSNCLVILSHGRMMKKTPYTTMDMYGPQWIEHTPFYTSANFVGNILQERIWQISSTAFATHKSTKHIFEHTVVPSQMISILDILVVALPRRSCPGCYSRQSQFN